MDLTTKNALDLFDMDAGPDLSNEGAASVLTYEERRDRSRETFRRQGFWLGLLYLTIILGGLGYQAYNMWRYQERHPYRNSVVHRNPDEFGSIRWDGHKWVGK